MEASERRRTSGRSSTMWVRLACPLLGMVALIAFGPLQGLAGEDGARMQGEQTVETRTVVIPVEGMSCASCVASVTRATKAVEGVKHVEVDLAGARATVEYVSGATSPAEIAQAIAALGYKTGMPATEPTE